ncbi:MAG: SDR family NAD(P)-dependent oxidoreductase [bacterium]|nr:SDR family NAD(P)-dependent oxidoreductase [bacterium]
MKKVMVVTGASAGIGKEFVLRYLKSSKVDEVWAIDRDKEGLDELEKIIDTDIKKLVIDLSKQSDIENYKNELDKEKPNVVLLANIAGFGKFDHSENIALDVKLNMIDVNVKAPVSMIDYSLPYMKKGSKIVNVASCAAFQPIPYINDYASTKAFLLSYSRALNQELKYRDVHVMTVTPFWTKTNFFDRAIIKNQKEVVIKYDVMYNVSDVVDRMISDLKKNKEISIYGGLNKAQRLLVKLLPHSLVMKIWMNKQKYDGTPNIR